MAFQSFKWKITAPGQADESARNWNCKRHPAPRRNDRIDLPAPTHFGRLLSELIVLRETKLPLAIGLFGNWGSGKSHFMNLMDRHMKWRSTHADDTAAGEEEVYPNGKWCKQIVPIYFNAWHYCDRNLWASLVSEVFDKLFAHLRPKVNELQLLHAQLQEAGGVSALAAEEVRNAEEHVKKATEALEMARDQSNHAKQFLTGLVDGLRSLVPELETPQSAPSSRNPEDDRDRDASCGYEVAVPMTKGEHPLRRRGRASRAEGFPVRTTPST